MIVTASPLVLGGPVELGLVALLALLLFGGSKLPAVARALGRAPGEVQRGHETSRPEDEER